MDRKAELRAELTRLSEAGIKASKDRDVAECIAVGLLLTPALKEYIALLDDGSHKDAMVERLAVNERLLSEFSGVI